MSIGLYVEIFILVGLTMFTGIVISTINESKMKERIDKLEDKIKALEERRKEDDSIH